MALPVKILITGGAGFIGSAVIRHVIANTQDSVVNLDKLTYAGNLESLSEVSSDQRYCFEQVDICERNEVERVFAEHKPDTVMQLAAAQFVEIIEKRQGYKIACLDEIAWRTGWLSSEQLEAVGEAPAKNGHGQYLLGLITDQPGVI